MFIRFIIRRQDDSSRSFVGLFTEAYKLRDSDDLDPHDDERLEKALSWMRVNVNVPKCLKEPGNDRAVSWFKPTAKEPLEWAWELVSILRENGVALRSI